MFRNVVFFAALLFLVAKVSSQTGSSFSHISINEGLSQSVVLDIVQDSLGFLWVATQDGLNRYDGTTFVTYRHQPKESNTIPDNWVSAILYQSNTLWVATENNGLGKIDFKTNQCEQIPIEFASPLRAMQSEKNGTLWIGSGNKGLFSVNPISLKYKIYVHDPLKKNTISDNRIRSILVDSEGTLWIGTGRGLNKFNKSDESFSCYLLPPRPEVSENDNLINSITEDGNHNLWIGTWKQLCLFNKSTGLLKPVLLDDKKQLFTDYITCGFYDNMGMLWFGTMQNGLYKITSYTENRSNVIVTYNHYTYKPQSGSGINCNYIRRIFADRGKNLWIGTWGGGLNQLNLSPPKFEGMGSQPMDPLSLHSPYVRAMFKDSVGNLLVGLDGEGIEYCPKGAKQCAQLKFDMDQPNLKDINFVYTFYKDNNNTIWIGTYAGLLSWPTGSPSLQKLQTSFNENNRNFSAPFIRAIKNYTDHELLLGSGSGLAIYNTVSRKGYYFDEQNEKLKLPQISVTSIARETPDVFWIGSAKGLFRCVLSRRPDGVVILKKLETFVNDRLEQSSLSSNKVNCIHIDKSGNVWIGTNLGLNRYDPRKKNFFHYFSVDGLPNEIINGILEDEQGTLWLSTNKGISRATRDKERLVFRNYDESDGLQSNEFNQGAFYKSVTGEMLFGGINGFNSFRPESVLDNPNIPQIALTQIKIGNRLLDNPTQLNAGAAEMDYSEGSVSFNFASLDFTNPRKNLYTYKLEGFDQEWSQPGTAPFAHYTNLDPGAYTFFVKGSNNDGIWNKVGTLIHLTIRPPYWMAWWFRFSVILLLFGLITIVVRYRLNRLLEMERLRTRIASDLHDEIGSSFTTITMYAAALQNETEVEKIVQKSKKIEEFSRAIIGSLSDVVWSIDSRNDSAGDLLDRIKDFLNISFGESTCRFSLTVHGIDEKKKLEVGLRQNVYLIFKETITNIVKHSTASFVEITLNNSAESGFIMAIRDNGTGFTAMGKKQGNGLRNMKARADKIGGAIQIVSDNGVFVQLKTKKI